MLMTMPLLFAVDGGDGPPEPDKGNGGPGFVGLVPIDGGIIALFVAGVFYGVKKTLKKK